MFLGTSKAKLAIVVSLTTSEKQQEETEPNEEHVFNQFVQLLKLQAEQQDESSCSAWVLDAERLQKTHLLKNSRIFDALNF